MSLEAHRPRKRKQPGPEAAAPAPAPGPPEAAHAEGIDAPVTKKAKRKKAAAVPETQAAQEATGVAPARAEQGKGGKKRMKAAGQALADTVSAGQAAGSLQGLADGGNAEDCSPGENAVHVAKKKKRRQQASQQAVFADGEPAGGGQPVKAAQPVDRVGGLQKNRRKQGGEPAIADVPGTSGHKAEPDDQVQNGLETGRVRKKRNKKTKVETALQMTLGYWCPRSQCYCALKRCTCNGHSGVYFVLDLLCFQCMSSQ